MKNRVAILGATVLAISASAAIAKSTAPAATASPVECATKLLYGKSLSPRGVARHLMC